MRARGMWVVAGIVSVDIKEYNISTISERARRSCSRAGALWRAAWVSAVSAQRGGAEVVECRAL